MKDGTIEGGFVDVAVEALGMPGNDDSPLVLAFHVHLEVAYWGTAEL